MAATASLLSEVADRSTPSVGMLCSALSCLSSVCRFARVSFRAVSCNRKALRKEKVSKRVTYQGADFGGVYHLCSPCRTRFKVHGVVFYNALS